MTTDKMPKPDIGVHRRPASTNWQWRIGVPRGLESLYRSEWAHRVSLETARLPEANRKAAALRAYWLARFDEQRRELNPQQADKITPELAAILAQRVAAGLLQADDTTRQNPEAAQLLLGTLQAVKQAGLSALRIGSAPLATPAVFTAQVDPLDGLPDALAAELAEFNQDMNTNAARLQAFQKVAPLLPLVQVEARKLGIAFDRNTPGALEALRECLKAYRTGWQAIAQRDLGEVVATPQAPTKQQARQAKPVHLRNVYDLWKVSKKRGPDALSKCLRALSMFEEQSGNPPVKHITRPQGDAFRSWLIAQPGSSKTAHDRLTWVKTLLGYASRDLELIPRQPWEGLDIEHHTETRRTPWTPAQLEAFFSLPPFTRYELPKAKRGGLDAAYWIPLLGLHTGATVSELAQLRVADVFTDEGGPVLRITDEGEGQQTKNAAGRVRKVPIHSTLIRLGFLEYVAALKEAGAVRLWPVLPLRKGKPGGYFSEWFREARAEASIPVPDFHSLRHTVRTAMTEGGVMDPAIKDRVCGHAVKGSAGTTTYDHPKKAIVAAVEAIAYPGLVLPRVFVGPVWKPCP